MSIWNTVAQIADGGRALAGWIGSGGHVVDRDTAQARADICLKCPLHDKNWKFTESIAAVIREQLGLKNKLKLRVRGEKSLHTCSVCGCAMRLKVWLPIERAKPDEDEIEKYDVNCWLRTETK